MPNNRGSSRQHYQPPVGVMARTKTIAESVIRELGLTNAVALNTSGAQGRGMALRALLVEESAWPLSSHTQRCVLPALIQEAGYVMRLDRLDPKELVDEPVQP